MHRLTSACARSAATDHVSEACYPNDAAVESRWTVHTEQWTIKNLLNILDVPVLLSFGVHLSAETEMRGLALEYLELSGTEQTFDAAVAS